MSKAPARKKTDIVQLKLRLREELRRKLEHAATKNDRSLNIEMVERLEASFEQERRSHEVEDIRVALESERQRLSDQIKEMQSALMAQAAALAEEAQITRSGDQELRTTIREVLKEGLQELATRREKK
jgi:hypothetical protein